MASPIPNTGVTLTGLSYTGEQDAVRLSCGGRRRGPHVQGALHRPPGPHTRLYLPGRGQHGQGKVRATTLYTRKLQFFAALYRNGIYSKPFLTDIFPVSFSLLNWPCRWTGTMSKQLQTQKEFLQALQAPIAYHNKLLKE